MSTMTEPRSSAPEPPATGHGPHLTFGRIVRSEWIKLFTVRSTWWILPMTVLAMAGFGWLVAHFGVQQANRSGSGTEDFLGAAGLSSVMVAFAQLTIAVLAVLTITGEYSTGMIRATLTAVPKRLPALCAKALVLLVVTLVVSTVGAALTWLVTRPVLGDAYAIDLADAENRRILLGAPLYLTGIALLAFAIGALLRHSAAAIATVLGLLLVLEGIISSIPWTFFQKISPFLPSSAGGRILMTQESIDATRETARGAVLSPWQGYGVLIAWGVGLLAVAAVLLHRRDA